MCVCITSPSREQRPTLRQLELCEKANPHGSGVAWKEGNKVRFKKGLSSGLIFFLLSEIDGPAIIHFRIATVGQVCTGLCHPFPITHKAEVKDTGTAKAVLFQNGTWRDYASYAKRIGIAYPKKEPVSDTRIAASMVSRFGFEWLERLDYCRWAMLDSKGIHRIGRWSKVGECHYSNLNWVRDEEPDFWNEIGMD